MTSVTGIVLAGGQSRRLGRDKAVETIVGQPMLHRVFDRIRPVCDDISVVVSDDARADNLPIPADVLVITDKYPGKGSLGGIYSGLIASPGEYGLVVACDMPFLNISLLEEILKLGADVDVCVPVISGRPEPTHALYSKNCVPYIKAQLDDDDLKITRFFNKVKVHYISEDASRSIDPQLHSFFNINRQGDLDEALALASQGL